MSHPPRSQKNAEVKIPKHLPAPVLKKKTKRRLVGGLSIAFMAMLGASLVTPTFAALESEASLGQNVISTVEAPPPTSDASLLLERIDFPEEYRQNRRGHWEWRKDQAAITLYGTKHWKKLDIRGWTLENSAGKLYTFQGKKWKHLDERTIHVKLKQSQALDTAGDFLILKNASGSMIDAISWDANTTYLNPSIQGVDPGGLLKRIRHIDTDSAADWRVKH